MLNLEQIYQLFKVGEYILQNKEVENQKQPAGTVGFGGELLPRINC
jgi:hypothetical protein